MPTRARSPARWRSARHRATSRSARARSGSRMPTAAASRASTRRRSRSVDTIDVGSRPSGIAVGNGVVWVANSLDGTVSQIDPATQRRSCRRSRSATARSGSPTRQARLGREHRRRHDHADRCRHGRPTKTLPIAATELAFGDRHAVGERARRRTASCGSIRRRGRSCSRSRSGTARRASPSATARCGWRTASTGPSRGSIRSTNAVAARHSVGDGPTAIAADARRRLGQQPVRRHAGAHRSADEPGRATDRASATARRASAISAATCSSASASPAPAIAAAR